MDRFFIPGISSQSRVQVSEPEARHMMRVLRMKADDTLAAFDGTGVECLCRIAEADGRRLIVEVTERRHVSREPAVQVTLAIAAPKAKAMDLIVQKCTELGLARLAPFHSTRSVARFDDDAKTDKWRRTAIEAAKQCGRNVLPEILEPQDSAQLGELIGGHDIGVVAALEQPCQGLKQVLAGHSAARRIIYIIGPEGGFESDELGAIVKAGAVPVSLGRSVLRVETAAIATLAMILFHYSDVENGKRS